MQMAGQSAKNELSDDERNLLRYYAERAHHRGPVRGASALFRSGYIEGRRVKIQGASLRPRRGHYGKVIEQNRSFETLRAQSSDCAGRDSRSVDFAGWISALALQESAISCQVRLSVSF